MGNFEKMYEMAIMLAEQKHSGQLDKGGQPYIGHLKRVADKLDNYELKTIAILHDILEDTDTTEQELYKMGFCESIVNVVAILTKPEGMEYFDYIARIKTSDKAKKVKLADLSDNMRIDRIPNPTAKDFERFEKYKKAIEILKD